MREMKDSGVEWIGEIPSHWEILANKHLMKKVKNIRTKYTGEDVLSLTMRGVIVRDLDNPSGKMPATFDGYQFVEAGNLLMCLFDIDVTPRCIGLIKNDGVCSPAYSQFHLFENADAGYYYYYYLHLDNTKELLHLAKNLRHSLTEEQLGFIPTVHPPIHEQRKIVAFLDKKLSQVDTLICNVQAQIEKLKAYKQSVITEVVIKGLDPTVPMKDSELLWFGNIPQLWELAKVKMFASTCSGGTPPSGDMSYYDGDVNWVCSYDLREREITETGKTLSEKGAALIAGELQSPNSILIAMYGGSGTIGNSGLLKCYARTNQAICSVHFDEAVLDPRFAFYQTMFIRKYWMYYAVGTRKDPNISQDVVRNMKYVIPPMEEQLEIVKLLDEKCSQIDRLITIKQEKIEKLEQYKRSQIYEYVTGKKAVV